MQATRTLQQRAISSLVRNTASKNGLLIKAAAASTSSTVSSSRPISTQSLSHDENLKLLNEQRLARPSSPHFTIYEPQLGWLTSIGTRITGSALSVLLYGFAATYPLGFFDAASIVSLVQSLPGWFTVSAKTILAFPFWWHNLFGIRHLIWDMGYFMQLKEAWYSGYVALGSTVVATIATVALL